MNRHMHWRGPEAGDFSGVLSALRSYFDGFYNSDADLLSKAFHASAHLYSVEKGGPRSLAIASYLDMVRTRKPIEISNRLEEVRSLSFIDHNLAIAQVIVENAASYFEDTLIFAKDAATWKTLSKTYVTRLKD